MAQRKLEARQRVILGAFILDTLKSKMDNAPVAEFGFEGYKLKDWLKQNSERSVFGIEPLKSNDGYKILSRPVLGEGAEIVSLR